MFIKRYNYKSIFS